MTSNNVTLKANILEADRPNLNGRIYTRETMQKMLEDFRKKGPVLGAVGMPELDGNLLELSRVTHKVKDMQIVRSNRLPRKLKKLQKKRGTFKRRSKLLQTTIELIGKDQLQTPGHALSKLIEKVGGPKKFLQTHAFRTAGIGSVDSDGVVRNFQLTSVNIVSRKDDAFPNI